MFWVREGLTLAASGLTFAAWFLNWEARGWSGVAFVLWVVIALTRLQIDRACLIGRLEFIEDSEGGER